jgi:cyclopropane fatty-acyl-phospholipid synthase-like methyltransferase
VQHTPRISLTGVDFAAQMLAQAQQKVPSATFLPLDLHAPSWPSLAGQRFARIVAGHMLHELPLNDVAALLQRLCNAHVAPHCRVVISDIAFPTAQMRAEAHPYWRKQWDADEFYFRRAVSGIGITSTATHSGQE